MQLLSVCLTRGPRLKRNLYGRLITHCSVLLCGALSLSRRICHIILQYGRNDLTLSHISLKQNLECILTTAIISFALPFSATLLSRWMHHVLLRHLKYKVLVLHFKICYHTKSHLSKRRYCLGVTRYCCMHTFLFLPFIAIRRKVLCKQIILQRINRRALIFNICMRTHPCSIKSSWFNLICA